MSASEWTTHVMVWGANVTDSWEAPSLRGYSLSEQAQVFALSFRGWSKWGLHRTKSRLAGVSMTSMFSDVEDQSLMQSSAETLGFAYSEVP